jgi:peptidoglycan/xylan/chitin deacetylase (PgdA/CDA1 family)
MGNRTKVALVFDDGFANSSRRTADIFENFGLRAVFAVLAKGFDAPQRFAVGDFELWNDLQSRGHFIQPHGYTHARLPDLPHEQAVEQMRLCLEGFCEKLSGFEPSKTVYHFTYNQSTPGLVPWLLARVAAVRTAGNGQLS